MGRGGLWIDCLTLSMPIADLDKDRLSPVKSRGEPNGTSGH